MTRCCLSRFPKPAVQISISGRSPNTKLGGFARGSLPRHWQADLAAEGGKARISLVAHHEGVGEKVPDPRIAVAPGSIEPLESRVGIVTKRVDLSDLVGMNTALPLDQRPKRSIGRAPVAADLPREGE